MNAPERTRSILDQDLSNKNYSDDKSLGAQFVLEKGQTGTRFSVWTPQSVAVSVVGYFNHWNGECHQLKKKSRTGIWSIFIPNLVPGIIYKYEIISTGGKKS